MRVENFFVRREMEEPGERIRYISHNSKNENQYREPLTNARHLYERTCS